MKRIRIIGLCLVAVFAMGVVAVASASAESYPNYKSCVKKMGGDYTAKTCVASSKVVGTGKYELVSVVLPSKFASKSKGDTITAKVEGKTVVVTCKKDKDEGEITGTETDTEVITLEGCILNGNKKEPCGTAGKITTPTLTSQLVFVNKEETKVADLLYSEVSYFVSFKCGTKTVELNGELLGEITGDINTANKDYTITFAVVGGKQTPSFEWYPEYEEYFGPYRLYTGAEVEATFESGFAQKGAVVYVET